MGNYHYKAFISYSHKDHRWGGWLHRRLERYRLPKHLIKNEGARRLKPIFRDREELSAADDLGEKIEQAIAASENLIVICSPDAAKSHWVNQEILSFKHQNRGAKIFSIIVEGEPFSGGEDECMPPALRFQMGTDGELTDEPAEPLAADLRTSGDGKRLSVLKIISGMLGVRLDELVQRDLQRNRNRVTAITAGALGAVLAMGTLTGFALSARQEADARRDAAEDMIEFMITELKPELEAVGRLKPLSIVGARAAKYYEDQSLSAHNDNALGRRARVFHMIGKIEVDDKNGDLDKAQARFDKAYASTKALLARDPNNGDRLFDHAQSAYWAAHVPYEKRHYSAAEPYYIEYVKLAEELNTTQPDSLRSLQELAYAYTNLGTNYYHQKQIVAARNTFNRAQTAKIELVQRNPNSLSLQWSMANGYAWLSDSVLYESSVNNAYIYRKKAHLIFRDLVHTYPENNNLAAEYVISARALARIYLLNGQSESARKLVGGAARRALLLVQHDTDNVWWLQNAINLFLLRTEIELVSGNIEEAQVNLATTASMLLNYTGFEGSNRQIFQELRIRLKCLELHALIINSEIATTKAELEKLLNSLGDVHTQPSSLASHQYLIPVRLLQFILLDDGSAKEEFANLISDENVLIEPTYLANIKVVFQTMDISSHRLEQLMYGTQDIFTKPTLALMRKPLPISTKAQIPTQQ